MKFESKFDIGQKVFCIVGRQIQENTVTQIRIKYTESPGILGENIFDNYKFQKDYKESYMCLETGTGSGNVYTYEKHIFSTREEADTYLNNYGKECFGG